MYITLFFSDLPSLYSPDSVDSFLFACFGYDKKKTSIHPIYAISLPYTYKDPLISPRHFFVSRSK